MAVPILKRRTRMVNFRVSEEEYERLKNLCLTEGCRSVSELTRTAINRVLRHDADPVPSWVGLLDGKVEELDRSVRLLSELVDGSLARRPRKRTEPEPAS